MTTKSFPIGGISLGSARNTVQSFFGKLGILFLALIVTCFGVACITFVVVIGLHDLGASVFEGDRYVMVPTDGKVLELAGVPGEQIGLRLSRNDSGARWDHSVLFARFRNEDSDFQTTIPVPVRAISWAEQNWLAGTLLVPGVPANPTATLSGVIWGLAAMDDGEPVSLEVPLHVRTLERGKGVTNGTVGEGSPLQVVIILMGLVAIPFVTALLYGEWLQHGSFGTPS
jgi:hypothetical protein